MDTEGKVRRKKLGDGDMLAALEAVNNNILTVSEVATTYNVPRKTLDDRVKGRVIHGTKPGAKTALTSECPSFLSDVRGRKRLSFNMTNGDGVCMGSFNSLWQ